MKKISIIFLLTIISCSVDAQFYNIDSLKKELITEKTDTGRINLLESIAFNYIKK
jgi:hypothetical protein